MLERVATEEVTLKEQLALSRFVIPPPCDSDGSSLRVAIPQQEGSNGRIGHQLRCFRLADEAHDKTTK